MCLPTLPQYPPFGPFPLPSTASFFFFNDTAPTEIYTLSLHDALPICGFQSLPQGCARATGLDCAHHGRWLDRKSTRLNSSHQLLSYAVFCLKKQKGKDC